MVSIKKISVQDTYSLRLEVLRKNIDLPHQFEGDLDENTFHLGVFEEDALVCIGTFMNNSVKDLRGKQYQLRGMASSTEARGKGYGKLLLSFATDELLKLKVDYLWCNARVEATGFYKKNGFNIIGKQFVNRVGPHYKMYKKLR